MAGFASYADLLAEAVTSGKTETFAFFKNTVLSSNASTWQTLWKGGGRPVAGADPAATPGTVYATDATAATAGAMWFPDRSTDQRYLLSFGAVGEEDGTLMLYDRLAGVSGIDLGGVGSKTVNTGALTRYSGTESDNNEVWLEVTSTAGSPPATAFNLDSYTTTDGSTVQSGATVTMDSLSRFAGAVLQMPLSATKRGVRSVESINVSASGGGGLANLLIVRPLARLRMRNRWNEVSFGADYMTLPRIYDDATLAIFQITSNGSGLGTVWGTITCVYG